MKYTFEYMFIPQMMENGNKGLCAMVVFKDMALEDFRKSDECLEDVDFEF